MNARIYDPLLGRFMSADPFIPQPTMTQSWNRYAYVYNNPLSYTDPTGFSPDGGDDGPGAVSGYGGDSGDGTGYGYSDSDSGGAGGSCKDPGDYTDGFNSRTAAHEHALDCNNPISRDENTEIGGRVCHGPHGYGYTTTKGDLTSVEPREAPCPSGTDVDSNWHTHGDYSDADGNRTNKDGDYWNSDEFSESDKNWADIHEHPISLGNPAGEHKMYNPETEEQTTFGYDGNSIIQLNRLGINRNGRLLLRGNFQRGILDGRNLGNYNNSVRYHRANLYDTKSSIYSGIKSLNRT